MTRIVLLLTAVPLAAVLALVLNTLLDRRLAASTAPARRAPRSARQRSRGAWIALALLGSGAAAPPLAHASGEATGDGCASIDCSLSVEAALVDRLWEPASPDGVVLVAQSRIPVWFDADSDPESEPEAGAPGDPDTSPAAAASLPTTSPDPR